MLNYGFPKCVKFFLKIKRTTKAIVSSLLSFLVIWACSNSVSVENDIINSDYDAKSEDLLDTTLISIFPQSGFYSKPFVIYSTQNQIIHCKIGGKEPTEDGFVLTRLQIDSSMVIRCLATMKNLRKTVEINRTYVFEQKPSIPVIF